MQGIVRLSVTVVLISTVCIGAMGITGTSKAQELGEQEVDVKSQQAYVKTALVYQWNRKNDYVTPTALLKAVIMAQEGRSENEIIDAVTRLRKEHEANVDTGLRGEWQVNEDYRAMIRHVGGLAGVVVGRYAKGFDVGKVTDIVSDLGIKTYEHLARDQKVIEASKAIGLMYQNVAGAEENIADLFLNNWGEYEVLQNVYAQQFEPELQIRPTDSIDEINMKLPDLSTQTNVVRLLEITSERLPIADGDMLKLKTEVKTILNGFRQLQKQDKLKASNKLEKERDRVEREGLRAGAFLAATFVGLNDPTLGRQLQAVSSAAFQAHDAFRDFKSLTAKSKDLTGSASLVMTASYVGAAMMVVSAFQDSGPSPEQMILEEIAKLRKDINNFRIEVHDQFGIVERKLSKVYARLDEGFKNLDMELRKQTRSLDLIVTKLEDVQNQISGSTALIIDRTEILEKLTINLNITDCVNWKSGAVISMSKEKYIECLLRLRALFMLDFLEGRQIKRENAVSSGSLSNSLREDPNDLAIVSLNSLEGLSRLDLPDSIPGPIDWQVAAKLYADFLEDWPNYFKYVTNKGLGLDELQDGADKVNALRSAAQQQLEEFSNGTTANAIERLLARVSARNLVLDEAIQVYKKEYYEEVINNPGQWRSTISSMKNVAVSTTEIGSGSKGSGTLLTRLHTRR